MAVEHECENEAATDEVFDAKGVIRFVVGCIPREAAVHEEADVVRRREVDDLHNAVVVADKGCEEVSVAGGEHKCVEKLRFEGNAGSGAKANHLREKKKDRE